MDNGLQRIKCLVVDDEPLAREVLVRFVGREPSVHLTGECGNAVEALNLLRQQPVDLLFLDIQMPELLGTDLLRILRNPPKVILTTAYPEFALEGFELDVVDYLLKPIQFERFLKAVHKASLLIGVSSGTAASSAAGFVAAGPAAAPDRVGDPAEGWLYFRTDRKMVKVMLEDILYIEGMKNYIKILTTHGLVITKHSMAAVEAMLPASGFLRTHRSYIVSQSKINSYTGEFIGIGEVEIPIGKLYKEGVMKTLRKYLQ
ncbi:MAG TPA: response regulator transcription factor [Puia sp.]|uniref:LytR/AlgR family response regulator transcription factor n=1 Tax=Puia sp. TaxID=2045100 RepID=UPI002BA74387|nr:response regulator transcription factor [Puia sp.]HVU94232.1 response regulator transcription factor [Puia sp.]